MNLFEERMKVLDLNDRDVAKKIRTTRQSVHNWRKGHTFPQRKIWPRVAKALGVTVDQVAQAGIPAQAVRS